MESEPFPDQIRRARRRQDAGAVVALVTAARDRGEESAALLLEAARAELSVGRLNEAQRWIERARQLSPEGAEQVVLDLEEAQIGVFRALDLKCALAAARGARQRFEQEREPVPPEVEWLSTRLLLAAAIYREIGPAERSALMRGLRQLQNRLLAAGLVDQAHAVAFKRAEQVRWPWSLCAWDAVAGMGRRAGLASTTGDALVFKAAAIRSNGGEAEETEAALRKAEAAFEKIGHRVGPLEVARERALLAVDRMQAPLETLEGAADALLAAGRPKETLSCLLDLATRAHRRGERLLAERTRARLAEIAEATGYYIVQVNDVLAHADLALRERDDARARDLCDQALARPMPDFNRAGILSLRGAAFSFAGDRQRAIEDRQHAVDLYLGLGADAEASDLIAVLAADIGGSRAEADLDEADRLLAEWVARDRARKDSLGEAGKTIERAGLCVLRALGRRQRKEHLAGEPALIAQAEAYLAAAERIFDPAGGQKRLPKGALPPLIGKIAQIRAQLATLTNDAGMMLAAQERARAAYEQVGLPYEAANCRYLIGCLLLNQSSAVANEQFGSLAQEAERQLSAALQYYDEVAGMRFQAAQTRHKLAMLYLNAQHRFLPETADTLCAKAGELLAVAADELDVVRQAFQAEGRLASFSTKSERSAEAAEIDREALRLYLQLRPDNRRAWEWSVRSKARALNDLLGAEALLPPDAAAAAEADPAIRQVVEQERQLSDALATAAAAERLSLREQQAALRARMRRIPALMAFVDLRTGAPAGTDDLAAVGAAAPHRFALVDWVAVHDRLYILVARPGEPPAVEQLPLGMRQVERFVAEMLGPRSFRLTLKHDAAALEELAGLVAPLQWLSDPGEHLVLCPTGALHYVPLQALSIGKEVLHARNPLAEAPSLGVLRLACQRQAGGTAGAAVFGDPNGDRQDALQAAERIGGQLGVEPVTGSMATVAAFEAALATRRLIHFQGHAIHVRTDPLASHLRLADGSLEARQIFGMRPVGCRMIALGACESAALAFRPGDEPFGLISALLIAGVRAVTAAAWNAQEESAGLFMDHYMGRLLEGDEPILALQDAAMMLRAQERFAAPYHWAPFRLYGDPWHQAAETEAKP